MPWVADRTQPVLTPSEMFAGFSILTSTGSDRFLNLILFNGRFALSS